MLSSLSPSRYEIVKYERPHLVELQGESDTVSVTDTIRLSKRGDQTHIDYHVNLSLKSWRRPFIVFLGSALNTLGREAMDGMRKVITPEKIAELEQAKAERAAPA